MEKHYLLIKAVLCVMGEGGVGLSLSSEAEKVGVTSIYSRGGVPRLDLFLSFSASPGSRRRGTCGGEIGDGGDEDEVDLLGLPPRLQAAVRLHGHQERLPLRFLRRGGGRQIRTRTTRMMTSKQER